jgi:hypothetical protein
VFERDALLRTGRDEEVGVATGSEQGLPFILPIALELMAKRYN